MLPSVFNISILTVTSVDNSEVTENACFCKDGDGGRLMSTCQFSHSTKIYKY